MEKKKKKKDTMTVKAVSW